jgi:hypothetical protein
MYYIYCPKISQYYVRLCMYNVQFKVPMKLHWVYFLLKKKPPWTLTGFELRTDKLQSLKWETLPLDHATGATTFFNVAPTLKCYQSVKFWSPRNNAVSLKILKLCTYMRHCTRVSPCVVGFVSVGKISPVLFWKCFENLLGETWKWLGKRKHATT